MTGLSRQLGKNDSYVHQYINRGSPQILPEGVREKLGEIFQCPESMFRGKPSTDPPTTERGNGKGIFRGSSAMNMRDLPVYRGGTILEPPTPAEDAERHIQRIERLKGVRDAFAVRIGDAAMAPGWNRGDMVLADPSDVPDSGDPCVVRTFDGRYVLGMYLGNVGDQVRLTDHRGEPHDLPAEGATIAREVGVLRR